MPRLTDQAYLLTDQYGDESNLNARVYVHQRFRTNSYPWQRRVFDHFDLPGRCDTLDVGCGPGHLWTENGDRLPPRWTIVVSDPSFGMVERARINLGGASRPFRYRVLDAQNIPFPDDSFDAVIASHVLYHVPDRGAALYEMKRVLRSGGRLYAATSSPTSLVTVNKNALVDTEAEPLMAYDMSMMCETA